MSKKNIESIDEMVAQRRELDRRIRAKKRADAKAAKAALLSERQALGVWLSETVGADSIESVQLLRVALESGQIQHHLRAEIGTGSVEIDDRFEDGDHDDRA